MASAHPPVGFDEKSAASYDDRFAKISAMRDSLFLQVRAVLADLPADAHLLSVGAGTGQELLALAPHFPQWRFTVVEPSAPMMAIAEKRAADHGFAHRCTFHPGYLDTLPFSEPFHAATCLLVSQFLVAPDARRAFFRQIAQRLHPQARLVSADLSGDRRDPHHSKLETIWFRLMEIAGIPPEQHEHMRQAWQRDVGFLPVPELEALIACAGFEPPVLFYQSILIRAWITQRTA